MVTPAYSPATPGAPRVPRMDSMLDVTNLGEDKGKPFQKGKPMKKSMVFVEHTLRVTCKGATFRAPAVVEGQPDSFLGYYCGCYLMQDHDGDETSDDIPSSERTSETAKPEP